MPGSGLRERKKLENYRVIVLTARDLVHARGLAAVTVDEIAATAGVSPRTFFNYFSSKEEAVVGLHPGLVAEIAEELRARPAGERPIEALRAVILRADPEATLAHWRLRNELVRQHPELQPRHLEGVARIEAALADVLAERLGTDPRRDPAPSLLVAAVLASIRAAIAWWDQSDRSRPLLSVLDEAFDRVAPLQPGTP